MYRFNITLTAGDSLHGGWRKWEMRNLAGKKICAKAESGFPTTPVAGTCVYRSGKKKGGVVQYRVT